MSILLGAIADDFTGATDLANTLVTQGMRAVQTIGIPCSDFNPGDAEAVIIALKSRAIPSDEAVNVSLAGLKWLQARGAQQIIFKYCSTFDSTDKGNIGPVADALIEATGETFTIVCPAFPANGRTIYKGHLFVGDILLSKSGMRNHPLTPMTDANLVSVLSRQTPHKVGLVEFSTVEKGAEAISDQFKQLQADGYRYAIVDALKTSDLMQIGRALAGLRLITGGSGVALGLPENFRRAGLINGNPDIRLPSATGRTAVLAGSCSTTTREQVSIASAEWPSYYLNPLSFDIPTILKWVNKQPPGIPIVIYSSTDPETVVKIQENLGQDEAGLVVERAMAIIAKDLIRIGFRRLIIAGGETAGSIVQALGINGLKIGPEIDPGIPWTEAVNEPNIALVLKSGNFGKKNFFLKARRMLND